MPTPDLALPKPENFRAESTVLVDGDVYHICERLHEISPNLYLYAYKEPVRVEDKRYLFCVSEVCADGQERFVQRFEGLDPRILKHIEYLLHVPFERRFEEAERLEAEYEQKARQDELDELYERVGRPMWTQLEHDGFIQRPVSYAKRGPRRSPRR